MTTSKVTMAVVAFVILNIALVLGVSLFAIPASGGVTIDAKRDALFGKVVNVQRQAVANAKLSILNGFNRTQSKSSHSGSLTAITNGRGQFKIENISSGTYTVTVEAAGYQTSKQQITITKPKNVTIRLQRPGHNLN